MKTVFSSCSLQDGHRLPDNFRTDSVPFNHCDVVFPHVWYQFLSICSPCQPRHPLNFSLLSHGKHDSRRHFPNSKIFFYVFQPHLKIICYNIVRIPKFYGRYERI